MAKLIVSEFVSLNGVMEAPGGEPTHPHSGWTFESIYGEDHYGYKLEEAEEAGSLLLGRKTYEGFSAAWPQRRWPTSARDTPSSPPPWSTRPTSASRPSRSSAWKAAATCSGWLPRSCARSWWIMPAPGVPTSAAARASA